MMTTESEEQKKEVIVPGLLDTKRLERELGVVSMDDCFFDLVKRVSFCSCSKTRRQGALIVRNGSVIAQGYYDAYEGGEIEVGSGAIENALALCARNGVSTEGAILYTYMFPSDIACKLIARAGIAEIKFVRSRDGLGRQLCEQLGIRLTIHLQK